MRRLLLLGLVLLALFSLVPVVSADDTVRVYYAGSGGAVRTALSLARGFEIVSDPSLADVFVLDGSVPDPALIHNRLESGAGVLLVLGPAVTEADVSVLLGGPVLLEPLQEPLSLLERSAAQDAVVADVLWNSAPQVRDRFLVTCPALTPLVSTYEDGYGSLILGVGAVGRGRAYVLTAFTDSSNAPLTEWAYFNYLVYHLVMQAAGRTPLSYADYPASPVPQPAERAALFAILVLLLFTACVAFVLARRYSRAHPELLNNLVRDRVEFEHRQAGTDWDAIGFHRPLGGFLLALMLGLVLFVPLIIYQNLILPVYVLPSAQALGIWGRVKQFFEMLWLLLDMGTSTALIKYFAQYRVDDPRQAVKYVQVFVWWQAISGAAQVAVVALVAGVALPRTVYALYAWSIVIHVFIQIPGFFQVMRHALTSLQRFDFAQVLDMALAVVFPMLAQPVFVLIMVAWGRAHPVFGPSMGGLLGLGLAAYAAEAFTFVVGFWLLRRLGLNGGLFFLAHFDWATVKKAFRFGFFDMLASVAWTIGQAMEVMVTQTRLINYTEIWGNWMIAQNFIYAYQVMQTLFNNLMPSISEAISHGRRLLSRYYAAMAFKWGGMISAYVGAVLLAVADRFILGASGPQFQRAALYAVPLIIWGAIQYPSWVGDNVQLASNRPWLKTSMVAGEQAIRIILAVLLLERFQINALIIAYFIGLLTKDIVANLINHRACFPQRLYVWQSLVAPLVAGGLHFLLLRWITGYIWRGDQATSVLILAIGILPSYPVFAFLYALVGGWDDDTLGELREAVRMSGAMKPLAWLFWAASRAGCRLSPLHGRFPIRLRAEALAEAAALTEERVQL
jgi:O-antigen/teichoic acid export membrane protein